MSVSVSIYFSYTNYLLSIHRLPYFIPTLSIPEAATSVLDTTKMRFTSSVKSGLEFFPVIANLRVNVLINILHCFSFFVFIDFVIAVIVTIVG